MIGTIRMRTLIPKLFSGVVIQDIPSINNDDEEEQLAHENLRTKYYCGDELALSHKPTTKTPMLLAVGRLVAKKAT